ncbi:type VI secretion system contractile sheath small subunit [Pantoea vagans]|uniref:type VI secretion system contractile sheath small subunit n=1 Tax=Pantoea vagans TaxID=470934 RepID=UPI00142D6B1F|nr:type VI secretion system contractile sheath small subunit [Pantoea vagans]
MFSAYQSEILKTRVISQFSIHSCHPHKNVGLPLKIVLAAHDTHCWVQCPLSGCKKTNDKNNFDSAPADLAPAISLSLANNLAGDGAEEGTDFTSHAIKDFEPEEVMPQLPRCEAIFSMRSLLHDLKARLLNNITFLKERGKSPGPAQTATSFIPVAGTNRPRRKPQVDRLLCPRCCFC